MELQDRLGLRALLARMVLQEALEPLEPQVTMELQEQLVLKEPQELQEHKVMSGQLERLELVKQELQVLRA
jgi:hypothetical protein